MEAQTAMSHALTQGVSLSKSGDPAPIMEREQEIIFRPCVIMAGHPILDRLYGHRRADIVGWIEYARSISDYAAMADLSRWLHKPIMPPHGAEIIWI